MGNVIELERVTKQYGPNKAVDHLSLSIKSGQVVALLGPNGAGKTTAISLILGLKRPTAGTVRLLGGNPQDEHIRGRIGAILQEVDVIDRLKVKEVIDLFRSYYAHPMPTERLLRLAGLEKEAELFTEHLSGGQKRRLQFALALSGDPEVIFLDEPTVGMDVTSRRVFWEMLRALAQGGRTIVLTTHYLEEADAIADRILVINHGKIVADGTPDQLKGSLGGRYISFIAGPAIQQDDLAALPGIDRTEWNGRHVKLYTANTDSLLFSLVERGFDMKDIEIKGGGLNEVFEQVIETEGAGIK
ncbi:ABC transporter ATP-binding protein [Paenibacillus sediminis]|uniref:ABC-2 type transport system ATP-binding protein n=1 Tax=Paenibacillus sediminis TaxID=664909 RepID=A0ABS4H3V3_9BACL|nr:ABC transporter ATP-binding protein [Paenibacillus sediminis]MBP1937213.1 ABC-2 type transport system ATP-binding protein [Paenibacillus sediminis]